MHWKGEFSKIKGSICNNFIEPADICNILQSPVVSNVFIVVKLKLDLKYRRHAYFEPVRPCIIYKAPTYLKHHNKCYENVPIAKSLNNKFYEDISIAKGLSSEDMLKFSEIVAIQRQTMSVTERKYFLRIRDD